MPKFESTQSRLETLTTSPIARAWRKTWSDYSDVSSMHGMKYIFDNDVSIYIRLIWAVTVLIMFILANQMAYSLYVDFISDPIRLIIENDHANTAMLLYPAVTVCPGTLFNHSKAKELILNFNLPENLTADQVIQVLDQTDGFIKEKFKYSKAKLTVLEAVMKLNHYTAAQFFQRTQWDFNEIFFRCRFLSVFENCSDVFRVSKTYAGLCYSFNAHQTKVPARQFKSNSHAMRQGLSFILKDVELDAVSNSPWFQVLIHEAYVYPDEFTFRKLLHRNEELLLRSQPTETICSREVWRRLSLDERKCTLGNEIKLRYFAEYRPQNCVIECRSLIMEKVCGCVPFFFFRERNTSVCDFEHIPCLSNYYERMLSMQKKCKCVDSCEKVDFSVRLTSTRKANITDIVDNF